MIEKAAYPEAAPPSLYRQVLIFPDRMTSTVALFVCRVCGVVVGDPPTHDTTCSPQGGSVNRRKAMTTTLAAVAPHAGFRCTVARPDGVEYEALLQRFDGPRGGLAVLYSDPSMSPEGEELYEHTVQVADTRLYLTEKQRQHIVAFAEQVLGIGVEHDPETCVGCPVDPPAGYRDEADRG